MAQTRTFRFPDIHIERHGAVNCKIKVKFDRIEKGHQKAQFALDSQVMTDMIPLMPRETGTFINVTRGMSAAIAGSGKVIAAAPPNGRFLYKGKVMVDPETNSPWARKGAKKVVTNRSLKYSNRSAVPEWFDPAKAKHQDQWVDTVRKNIGGK